jgi:Rhodopirellula transposase DDE domain
MWSWFRFGSGMWLTTAMHGHVCSSRLPGNTPGYVEMREIEHRLFSYISTNWCGQPLVSLAVIVSLIGATRTAAGLRVRCELDRRAYPKGQAVSDAQMATLNLVPHRFHGDWNYTLHPARQRR